MNRILKRGLGILLILGIVILISMQFVTSTKSGTYQQIDGQTGEVKTLDSDGAE
ncbi:hypothetical protein [Saccharibacillus endophyticus]|uniref:YtzI protein n=1 Tax=Saccharibacillus endophyticus TaxID=2060666 RepID=A0ABQ1ZXJ6_9BACL|nr:hypothetical protein [Saccharibacillus endophyticus]GGH79485.1 hypothetical protein GCM10007362_26350 [Saccharibacillus endophyticus]